MRTALTRADRQAQTREELVEAADRLFTTKGFHATAIDAVADAAGYTKGAVYSNFASKEDLFFAVYERRVDRRVAEMEATLTSGATAYEGMETLIAALEQRQDDGWLAAFFEFWAHVLRHPELRGRFAAQHRRGIEPVTAALERLAAERGERLPDDAAKLATARQAMLTGLQLERLTQPDLIDQGLGVRMLRLAMSEGGVEWATG
jgi:AcrR family transcriptional regulator